MYRKKLFRISLTAYFKNIQIAVDVTFLDFILFYQNKNSRKFLAPQMGRDK